MKYTHPEPHGIADVTYIFPGGRTFVLENGLPILVDDLKPGMRLRSQTGMIITVTGLEFLYDPPPPPITDEFGRTESRVIGTVKHITNTVMDVGWQSCTVTSTPDHRYYSVTRQAYVPARDLRLGELLRTDAGSVVPVESLSPARQGRIEVYNLEIEHFHNYFVGEGTGVLVHNGGCIVRPSEVTEAEAEMIAAERLSVRTPRELGLVAPDQHHIFPQEHESWFTQRRVNIHDYAVTPEGWEHGLIHDTLEWNDRMMSRLIDTERSLNGSRLLTPAEIEGVGYKMLQDFGLEHLEIHPYRRG